MTPIKNCILNKDINTNPIWLMRQAGRYLPEFREIRKKNSNFINLCLNPNLSEKITLQPIDRFGFDAAIIFSDILMIPYGLGQKVEFKKNFGPNLGDISLNELMALEDSVFYNNLSPIYELLKPSYDCCQKIYDELLILITELLQPFVRFPDFANLVKDELTKIVVFYLTKTKQKIKNQFDIETNYIWTDNQDFHNKLATLFTIDEMKVNQNHTKESIMIHKMNQLLKV